MGIYNSSSNSVFSITQQFFSTVERVEWSENNNTRDLLALQPSKTR